MILVAASAIAATFYDDGRQYQTVVVVSGGAVFWFGLMFEAVADMQLTEFVRAKRGRSQILTTGLWRYSRHPNYFSEVTAWWGLWIIAVASAIAYPAINTVSIALLAMISPITITILILKVSGIPMLEAKYAGTKAFEAYKQRTSAFCPWFPGAAVGPGVDPGRADPQAEPPLQHSK
jgi:steroid 5-alpha reductase family enzyme